MSEPFDLIVVGGGPVGLHAALKAAILNHTVLLIDRGARYSRISQAKAIANVPGHPGISGVELLALLRRGLDGFAKLSQKRLVTILDATTATSAERDGALFRVQVRRADGVEDAYEGRALLLATGVVDRKPGIDTYDARGHETIASWTHRGAVGYCLLCEGWDLQGKDVVVIGASADGASMAADVKRQFGGQVTLALDGAPLEPDARRLVRAAGVRVAPLEIRELRAPRGVEVEFEDGEIGRFDKALLSLGWYKANNELACMLGAKATGEGFVATDDAGRALGADGRPVPGLFVAGDLRAGRWKQIVIGWGDAETAVISAYAEVLPPVDELPPTSGRHH